MSLPGVRPVSPVRTPRTSGGASSEIPPENQTDVVPELFRDPKPTGAPVAREPPVMGVRTIA